ncbi:LOW QUALITY PROTEIN: hypothetical protein PanWU01x14_029320 [Parasponia andersonii]|uniref:Uncharacterized protein n=1 Tax=Parasponia andersonii TaxID=3476 RepID=A0A2P5DVI4_PARAD|nr:LOW QUALITY PROTEIN: hypothetical protein PanWU01x14_029320 [Parasponia andersonii]
MWHSVFSSRKTYEIYIKPRYILDQIFYVHIPLEHPMKFCF